MKSLWYLLLIPLSAFAIDPDLPVVRVDENNAVVAHYDNMPNRYKNVVNYRFADYRWESDGFRQGQSVITTNEVVTLIPAAIQAVASSYKASMETIYGAGAVTNRTLTKDYVAIDLSLNTNITADVGLRLLTWYEILNEYWGTGEVWTFPYDQASYTNASVIVTWEAIP